MSSCGLMSNGVIKILQPLGNMNTMKQKDKSGAEIFLKFPNSPPHPHNNKRGQGEENLELGVLNKITRYQKHLKCNHSNTMVAFSTL